MDRKGMRAQKRTKHRRNHVPKSHLLRLLPGTYMSLEKRDAYTKVN